MTRDRLKQLMVVVIVLAAIALVFVWAQHHNEKYLQDAKWEVYRSCIHEKQSHHDLSTAMYNDMTSGHESPEPASVAEMDECEKKAGLR